MQRLGGGSGDAYGGPITVAPEEGRMIAHVIDEEAQRSPLLLAQNCWGAGEPPTVKSLSSVIASCEPSGGGGSQPLGCSLGGLQDPTWPQTPPHRVGERRA